MSEIYSQTEINSVTSLETIISALSFYQNLNIEDEPEQLIKYFANETFIEDSFCHILFRKNYEEITNEISKTVANCSLNSCKIFVRYNRDRESNKHKQTEAIYYQNVMDNIHTFFMHSYDTGMRIKNDSYNHKMNHNRHHIDNNGKDLKLINLKSMQNDIKYKMRSIENGLTRFGKNKFFYSQNVNEQKVNDWSVDINATKTFLDLMKNELINGNVETHDIESFYIWLATNEYDSDAVSFDVFDEKENNIKYYMNTQISCYHIIQNTAKYNVIQPSPPAYGKYSFGIAFNYWDKEKYDIGNVTFDEEYKIFKKYGSLRFEILNNKIWAINIEQWETKMIKCSKLLQYMAAKAIKARAGSLGNVKKDDGLTLQNLMSIVLYTDYTKLQYEFTKTFRSINEKETTNMIKERNREYWNWAKLLKETVYNFGTSLKGLQAKKRIFYTGMSEMIFDSFYQSFVLPTSTSAQKEVATLFAEDGLILELKVKSPWINYFDCSWMSSFSNEDEKLFCSPWVKGQQLRFYSIISVANKANYRYFLRAMTAFNVCINGGGTRGKTGYAIQKDLKIIGKLFSSTNKFSFYINSTFRAFLNNIQTTRLNIWDLSVFTKYFIDSNTNTIAYSSIFKMFPKCVSIEWRRYNTDRRVTKEKHPTCIASKHVDFLLMELDEISRNPKKQILIEKVGYLPTGLNNGKNRDLFLKSYSHKFVAKNCKLTADRNNVTIDIF